MKKLLLIILFIIINFSSAFAISKEDIIRLSYQGVNDTTIIDDIKHQGLQNLTESDIKDLYKNGVSKNIINYIEHNICHKVHCQDCKKGGHKSCVKKTKYKYEYIHY